jgi:acyl-CoA hydrolase
MTVIMETESARRVSAEDAAALVRSGDWLDYGAVLAQPDAFDKALAARVGELRNVNIRGCLSLRPRAVLEADPEREHFNFFNWHLGGYDRKLSDAGRQNYIPCNLGEIPDYYRASSTLPRSWLSSPARSTRTATSTSARRISGTARWRLAPRS